MSRTPMPAHEAVEALKRVSVPEYEEAVDLPVADWARMCHAVSLALVRSGLVTELTGHRARVARGSTRGVGAQHSWAVLGDDCYSSTAVVVDLTLWSYDPSAPVVCVQRTGDRPHVPQQAGSIMARPLPEHQGGETIELAPSRPLGLRAQSFLDLLGPLDARGWAMLAHGPMQDWPSPDIITAMKETPELAALVPIDVVGMLTEHNPGGLYF